MTVEAMEDSRGWTLRDLALAFRGESLPQFETSLSPTCPCAIRFELLRTFGVEFGAAVVRLDPRRPLWAVAAVVSASSGQRGARGAGRDLASSC
jgi:hypothetical protein